VSFFFQAEDGIRDRNVTGVQTCALPICVALLCSNRPEWLPIAFGAARLGAILVPLSTLWTRDELAYALAHADVELLIMLPGFLKHDYLASLAGIEAPLLRSVALLDGSAPGTTCWDDLPAAHDASDPAVSPRDPAVVFFTSGTTAQAKAVVHSHGA